jgi:hypothetical protein
VSLCPIPSPGAHSDPPAWLLSRVPQLLMLLESRRTPVSTMPTSCPHGLRDLYFLSPPPSFLPSAMTKERHPASLPYIEPSLIQQQMKHLPLPPPLLSFHPLTRWLTHLSASRNNFSHTMFNWVMTPMDMYTMQVRIRDVVWAVAEYKVRDPFCACTLRLVQANRHLTRMQNLELLVFGNGDGAGPPLTTASTLMKNSTPTAPPHPCGDQHAPRAAAHMGHSDKFFNYLVESSQGGKVLPTWKGSSILILNQCMWCFFLSFPLLMCQRCSPRCSSWLCDVSVPSSRG